MKLSNMPISAQVYQNWTKDVTHLIASHKDFKFGAHVKQQRDVVCLDWLMECQQKQERIPIKPHHYLHLSKKTLLEVPDVCRFGDTYALSLASHHGHAFCQFPDFLLHV